MRILGLKAASHLVCDAWLRGSPSIGGRVMRNVIIDVLVERGLNRSNLERLNTDYLRQLYMEFS